jgi:predicted patatin/cPLA2 family phospholipase
MPHMAGLPQTVTLQSGPPEAAAGERTALILEGGGLRGNYTAGVLRHFMECGIRLPYVIGVSIGACNGSNYVSGQIERSRIVNTRFVRDRRFLSYRRLLRGGELFGMAFIFDTIPNVLVPFDYEAFAQSPQRFVVTATDCETGEAVYYEKRFLDRTGLMRVLQAGCSLPLIQHPVPFNGRILMDGGLADPLPLAKSLADGNTRQVVVLTRPRGYRKQPSALTGLLRLRYPRYRGLHRALRQRHARYNATLEDLERLERAGAVFTVRPPAALGVHRAERDPAELARIFDQGYRDAKACYAALQTFLRSSAGGGGHP